MRPSLPPSTLPLPLAVRKIVSPRSAIRTPAPASPLPEVSIIIPARNEEANLPACLESLTAQSGVRFEIIVVDDASTDRTHEIADSFGLVQMISPSPLRENRTGKNNALIAGAKQARAPWLLFTDADTVHQPGSLQRALAEAKKEQADLLSYSPKQVVVTFTERAVMPVIFAELAAQYPPHKVRDQNSKIVAANGQYILVRRAAYDAIGGHAAVASEILEDVALARLFRNVGYRVYFRYGADAVRTRMYRNWKQLREGWTKNLALLFPHPEFLAFKTVFWWFAAWVTLFFALTASTGFHHLSLIFAAVWLLAFLRISRARFSPQNNLLAIALGPPIFAYLLLRSKQAHAHGQVSWKGRFCSTVARDHSERDGRQPAESIIRESRARLKN
ncbi:MAG TPA: glycosyltransferase family 2 protein [Terriglobales bacterium]|jgi:glycosyltransferase involved in cell wall biosynthesis|nr:glycosyltransferase family 2 protein [Terriglobales bacterium]